MEASAAGRSPEPSLPEFKRNYPVFRFVGSSFISYCGDQIQLIAIPLLVLAITGSPVSMGIVTALERLPVLLQPLTGIWSDRLNRKTLLLLCDLGRGVITGLLGLLFIMDSLEMWHVYIAALAAGVLGQIYTTAQIASVPNLVRKSDLQTVNAVNSGFANLAVLAAPGLGGMVIGLYNPGYAVLVNSATFFISFLTVLSLPIRKTAAGAHKANGMYADLKEGFQFVVRTKPILFTNLAMLVSVFGTTLFLTMMVFHLKETIQLPVGRIGWLLSAGGLGAVGGALVTAVLRKRFSYRTILFAASCLGGLSVVVFSQSQTYAVLLLSNAAGTITASAMNPCIVTIRQTLTPDRLLGRVQATSRFMTWTLMPVAAFLAGVLAEQFGTHGTILLGGLLSTAGSLLYLHPSLQDKQKTSAR
ncbi:MFS transporter [Paenibacillus elgii]|uniref:MFS transporter n=1 Tax=Paenibacillus elgii TaxID=189691 RepID=A0A163YVM6_9BACL|nr:MFS transporter [Paenibacillus elgii]KZE80433.1 MFS transporter [Paenibacillus elgii]NEN84206.1 MFS transporter [Paenibacillus elgii]